jgi:hypothetical protein
LDKLKLLIDAKANETKIEISQLGLGEKRQIQKYEKVN